MSGDPIEALEWHTVGAGDELPPLTLEVTATVVVAGALATRDFMPVHHDRAYAEAQGAADIFMNILSTNAYCSRFLTDWAGPDTMVRRLSIRLGVPTMPGTTLTFSGRVTGTEERDGEGWIEVELVGANDLGDHVTGTAALTVPLS